MLLAMKTRNVIGAFRSVFCHSLTVVNFCWFSSHSVVVSLAWVHRSISRLIGAGICWLRFSGVCSKLLSQLSKSESLIVVGRIRNACHTDPVDFGNAALSLPTNNLSRPHGGGNITNLYILHDNSGRIISKVWEVTLLSFSLKLLKQPSTISFFLTSNE